MSKSFSQSNNNNNNKILPICICTESMEMSQDQVLTYEIFVGCLAYSVTEVSSVVTPFRVTADKFNVFTVTGICNSVGGGVFLHVTMVPVPVALANLGRC